MKTSWKTKDLTQMALLVALLSASSYISIPLGFTPVDLTLQTLMVNLIGLLLLPGQACLTIVTFVLLGLIGVPVFAGGTAGPAKLFGPSGGYIFSWILAATLVAWLKPVITAAVKKIMKHDSAAVVVGYSITTLLISMPVIYILGTVYMKMSLGTDWMTTLTMAVFPFIPLDIFKCIAAACIAVPVKKAISHVEN